MPKVHRFISAAVGIGCLMVPAISFAEEDAAIIVTATRAPQSITSTGQSISVLTQSDIQRLAFPSVSDLLALSPGVTVTRNGGVGATTAVRIRGAEGEHTLTLIDGVRVNDPSSPGGAFDFGTLLSDNVARIEVLRGPGSVPWGSQAIGGVVNVVTAVPAAGASNAGITASFGGSDEARLNVRASTNAGPITAAISGGFLRSDGVSSFVEGTEQDGFRQVGGSGRMTAALSSNVSLDLRGYYAHSRVQLDGFPPPFFAFADTSEYSTSQEIIGYAGLNVTLADGAVANRIALTASDINRDNFSSASANTPSFLSRGRSERIEYQGDAKLTDGLRSVFGLEHERTKFTDGFAAAQTHVTSAYVQAIADPIAALSITLGGRIDDHREYGQEVTLAASTAWRAGAGVVIRAAYGEGFKAPTLYQLGSIYGNRALQPEEAKSVELGVEKTFAGGSAQVGLTVFQRLVRNQIDFVSCFGQTTGICTDRPFGTYNNVKRTRARGFEMAGTLRPVEALRVNLSYSYVDAKDRDGGLVLLRRPRHSLAGSLDWDVTDHASLGAIVRVVSDSIDTDYQTFSRTRLDGYGTLGLRSSIALNDLLTLTARIDNVTNAEYATVSGYGVEGRSLHAGIRFRL